MTVVNGRAYKDIQTKHLIEKIGKNSIAVIKHKSIDLVAAQELKYKKVKAVINCEKSASNRYLESEGTKYLLCNGIKIYDVYDSDFYSSINDGDKISIIDDMIFVNNIFITSCVSVLDNSPVHFDHYNENTQKMLDFLQNTIHYMEAEINYFIQKRNLPQIDTLMKGKEVLIISRGRYYREDLKAIKKFISYKRPVLIGVDGGANALLDLGFSCDIIIGDMDSVSDKSLYKCREIVVHSYSNGYAPGLKRIESLGLPYKLIDIKGTSEDAALYLAKFKGASTIYTLGSHTCIEEFIEKGRKGMGSTAILRILTGSNVIDLKGINKIMRYNKLIEYKIYLMLLILFACLLLVFSFIDDSIYIQSYIRQLLEVQ